MPAPPPVNTGNSDLNKYARRNIMAVVFLTLFLDLVGFSIIFPLFPAMLDYYLPPEDEGSFLAFIVHWLGNSARADGGIGDSTFLAHVLFGGFLGSLYSLLQFVFAPFWGRLSDRYGRKPILLLTISGNTLGYLLWAFSGSFWLLVASRILSGTSSGNLSVATAAVADITLAEKRSRGMALVGVAFGLGFLFGPAIGGFSSIIDLGAYFPELVRYGINPFSVPAFIAFSLSVLNLLWVALKFNETLPLENRDTKSAILLPEVKLSQFFGPGSSQVKRTNLVYFLFILAFSGMEFTLTFLSFERLGYMPVDNAKMFLFIGFSLILVQGGLVHGLVPKLGEKPLLLCGLVCGSAAFACLAFASTWQYFYVGLGLLALGAGLSTPTLTAFVSLYSGEREQGRVMGAFRSSGSLGRAIGPLMAAAMYWYFGSQVSYLYGSCILLAPLFLASFLPRPQKIPDASAMTAYE